uniref:Uncharacterized protein n=1 Tax=Romanomermis culicivorax TaxID=13658 RepID=A0A915IYT9_ROMCU
MVASCCKIVHGEHYIQHEVDCKPKFHLLCLFHKVGKSDESMDMEKAPQMGRTDLEKEIINSTTPVIAKPIGKQIEWHNELPCHIFAEKHYTTSIGK